MNTIKINLNKDYIVTLHNDLVQARFSESLNLTEQKILYTVLSNINSNINNDEVVEDIPCFRVPIKEFTNFLGFKDENYNYFKQTMKKLMRKVIEIQQPNGSWELFQWVTNAKYISNEGMAEITLSPSLYPYLINLDKNFTKTKLSVLLSFKSHYSSRLYQLLEKWAKLKSWTIEIDELKHLLGVPMSEKNGVKTFKLSQYGHFKSRCLNVALDEVNSKTDLKVSFDEIRTGRKITSITLNIERRKKKQVDKNDSSGKPTPSNKENKSFGSEFLKNYKLDNRNFVCKKTNEKVLFDGVERAKAIIFFSELEKNEDNELYKIEELILDLFEYEEHFDVPKEINKLANHVNKATTIKYSGRFIISKLKDIKSLLEKGNKEVCVSDVMELEDNEVIPIWWYDGLRSKKVVEQEENFDLEEMRKLKEVLAQYT